MCEHCGSDNPRGFITIVDGKFNVECPGVPMLITDDPVQVQEFFNRNKMYSLMCSSSVDFPEEYGMPQAKVDQLFPDR